MTPIQIGLILCAAVLTPLAIMVFLAWRAPEGYQDGDGFHYGKPPADRYDDPSDWGI